MKCHHQDMKAASWLGMLFTTHIQCTGFDIHCSRKQMVIPLAWIEVLNPVLFEWLSFSQIKSFIPFIYTDKLTATKFLEVFTTEHVKDKTIKR